MRKTIRRTGIAFLIILCTGFCQGCSNEALMQPQIQYTEEDKNREIFYEKAGSQGINSEDAERYFQTIIKDDILGGGAMELTGLIIDDIDGNGQNDMLVMVLDAAEKPIYGSGSLWFYMNDDEPYEFSEENCSFYGQFDAFWSDIDNDENTEIIFSSQGSGCGGAGDFYKAIFKYKDHSITRMELPSDLNDDIDRGLKVEVCQSPEENSYIAYCPYLDEIISFQALNSFAPPDTTQIVGGNVRGYFDLQCAEYEGQNALQVSEYLHGEGGIVQGVAIAQFLIVWDENGEADVAKWWILMNPDSVNSGNGSRIVYTDAAATAHIRG